MNKKYVVRLTEDERARLEKITQKGNGSAYRIKHAHILLQADVNGPCWSDEMIAKNLHCHTNTVCGVRKRLVELGLEAALEQKKREIPPRQKILDGEKEARLIAVSCGKPPKGYSRWTLRLLADKMVELEIVDTISYETVRRTLKKTN